VRILDANHIRAILMAVQPVRIRVAVDTSEINNFKNLIQEVQADICKAHEAVARCWLNSESGLQWIETLSSLRKQQKALPHLTPEQMSEDLALSVKEVKALWSSISSVVHPDHWNQDEWYQGETDSYIFEEMESTSYNVIAKMATGLNVGPRAHRTLNVQARLRILACVSSLETPDKWPKLPTDIIMFPADSHEGWKGYPDCYPTCTGNDDFARIFGRFGEAGIAFFTKLANRPYPYENSNGDAPETTAQSQSADVTANQDKEVLDLTCSQITANHDKEGLDITSSQITAGNKDKEGLDPTSSQIKSEPHDNAPESLNTADWDYVLDADGNQVLLVGYDDDDEPIQSSWMHAGDELEKITDPAVQRLAHLAGLDKAEDLKAIADWTAYHNPDMTFITPRAFDVARLGGWGLARYALDDLMADAEVYGNLADHFANRRVARLADAQHLSQVLSDVQKKLATLEEEAAKYRGTTGKATALQQNVTQSKRIMARVQAQLQGARVNAIHNPRLARGTVPPPSSSQTASSTPHTPTRQTSEAPLAGLSRTQSDKLGTQFDESEWAADS
jgi:hypothetical protein